MSVKETIAISASDNQQAIAWAAILATPAAHDAIRVAIGGSLLLSGAFLWFNPSIIPFLVNILVYSFLSFCFISFFVWMSKKATRGYREFYRLSLLSLERQKALLQVEGLRIKNQKEYYQLDIAKSMTQAIPYGISQGSDILYNGPKSILEIKRSITEEASAGQLALPAMHLPSTSLMIEVARRHEFSVENIFLAQGPQGDITTNIKGYVHCANDGSTGSGKTSNWRGQLVQFLKAGVGCILLSPHFMLINKVGEDWRPIARSLEDQGGYGLEMTRVVTAFDNITAVLQWLATSEIDRRFQMSREGCFDYKPLYAYIDEWPAIVSNCKDAPAHLRTILQRGRAVEVCVSVNSQGFLADDTDLKGSARENFDTAFFMGGSTYSGAKLLDLKEATLKEMMEGMQAPLGKGVAFLRSNHAMNQASLVRLPYADNDFLYYTLGHADDYRLPPEPTQASSASESDMDLVEEAALQLQDMGRKPTLRAIAEMVPFGKDKVAPLLATLKGTGRL